MNWVVVAYYTVNTLYQEEAKRLISSLQKFNIPHDVQGVKNLGDWWKNTGWKPTFLKQMLAKHYPKSIIYVDCDAEFLKYPDLFDTFAADIGVYVFDRSEYRLSEKGKEVLSGTIWLRNNTSVVEVVSRWEKECQANPKTWDQKSLEKALAGKYTLLPAEYCKIFDRMKFVKSPVIVHYQASRKARKQNYKV